MDAATGEPFSSREELLRGRSLRISDMWLRLGNEDKIGVVGRFSKVEPRQYLHEEYLQKFFVLLRSKRTDVQIPEYIEFEYMGAYESVGYKNADGTLVPLEDTELGVKFLLTDNDWSILTAMPPTEKDVVGFLQTASGHYGLNVTAYPCPSYGEIEPDQLSDLLECYRAGECQ